MTGPEHYRAAQNLIRTVKDGHSEGTDVANIIAAAQVHATLALAAATAMQAPVDGSEPGMSGSEYQQWFQVAGVQPGGNR